MAAIKLEQQQKQIHHINERNYNGKSIIRNSRGDRIMIYWNFCASYFWVTMLNLAEEGMPFTWTLYPHIPESDFSKTASIHTYASEGLDFAQQWIGSKTG